MDENRRPVSTRQVPFFQKLAKKLVGMGLTPNQISVLSVVFAAVGALSFTRVTTAEGADFYFFIMLSLLGIQARLICNLIDGLMAVEGGLKTPTGELYNDIPDRFSDVFLFLGAASAIPFSWGMQLGWAAGVSAILTAYVRVLGASMQQGHDFGGPLAKQHRMFVLNLALIAAVIEKVVTSQVQYSLVSGLGIITVGSFITIWMRVMRLARKINLRRT